jgi:hypothetical protein
MSRTVLALSLVLLAACGGERLTEQQRTQRREARRNACITEALQARAHTQLARLDTILQQSQGTSAADIARAPHVFAQVYATYADLRAHEAAYVDSAFHATSKADSLRFVESGRKFRLSAASPGSVEENVVRDYSELFLSWRDTPRHPCNRLVDGEVAESKE